MSVYISSRALRQMLREYRKMLKEGQPPAHRSWFAGVLRRANSIRLQQWAVDPVPSFWQQHLKWKLGKMTPFPVPRIFLSPQVRERFPGHLVGPLLEKHFQEIGSGGPRRAPSLVLFIAAKRCPANRPG